MSDGVSVEFQGVISECAGRQVHGTIRGFNTIDCHSNPFAQCMLQSDVTWQLHEQRCGPNAVVLLSRVLENTAVTVDTTTAFLCASSCDALNSS